MTPRMLTLLLMTATALPAAAQQSAPAPPERNLTIRIEIPDGELTRGRIEVVNSEAQDRAADRVAGEIGNGDEGREPQKAPDTPPAPPNDVAIEPPVITVDPTSNVPPPPASISDDERSDGYSLSGTVPNPILDSGTITFALARTGRVTLKLYDMTGREVRTMVDNDLTAGTHTAVLQSADLPPGRYTYRLVADGVALSATTTVVR